MGSLFFDLSFIKRLQIQLLESNYKSNFKGVGVTKKIESEVIKRLQALNPETVRLDEMNRV
ncbi:hypothetical protein, partial [Klebsiella pneumoniae]|uniref:hypothetical protein n=1 Tax=Klebsiella pneumoniae TaxID=573 RepID=UPI001C610928